VAGHFSIFRGFFDLLLPRCARATRTMTGYLPPGMKELFAPREPLPFAKPLDKAEKHRKPVPITGIAAYAGRFEDPAVAAALPKPTSLDEQRAQRAAERRVSSRGLVVPLC
jgi:hypothetical protein